MLPNGTKVEITDEGHTDWGKTTYKGKTGYVHFDYLKLIELVKPKYEYGDVNRNGMFDIDDLVKMRYHLYQTPGYILSPDLVDQGDVNRNGIIDIDDIMKVRHKIYNP